MNADERRSASIRVYLWPKLFDNQTPRGLPCSVRVTPARYLLLTRTMIREDTLEITPFLADPQEGAQCVLLVEDDPALRRYLEVVLQRAGYAVLTAGDGLEGMKFLLTAHVDIVVTDALMPNLDGYELCRFVRNSDHLAHLPIILLSALDPKNSTDESEQVNAFLAKPVSPEDLLACIENLLGVLDQRIQR
jgi:twitching motility two-component system response regulator PilH